MLSEFQIDFQAGTPYPAPILSQLSHEECLKVPQKNQLSLERIEKSFKTSLRKISEALKYENSSQRQLFKPPNNHPSANTKPLFLIFKIALNT